MHKILRFAFLPLLAISIAGCSGGLTMDAATRLENAGDFQGALSQYKQASQEKPKNAQAFLGIGRCYQKLNQTQEADDAFRAAVKADGSSLEAKIIFGNALLAQNNLVESKIQFDDAYALDSKYAPAVIGQAKVLEAQNNPKGAVAKYKEAVTLDPNNIEVRTMLVHALGVANQFNEAKKELAEIDRIRMSAANKK